MQEASPKNRFFPVLDDTARMSPTQTERYMLGWAAATAVYLPDKENIHDVAASLLHIAQSFMFEKEELQYVANVALILLERYYRGCESSGVDGSGVDSGAVVAILVIAIQISSDEIVQSGNLKNVRLVPEGIPGLIRVVLNKLNWNVFVSTHEYNVFRFSVLSVPCATQLAMTNATVPKSRVSCTLPWKRSENSMRLSNDVFALCENTPSHDRVRAMVWV